MARERLYLFDTTLRDGAQTNGVDFTLHDKLALAGMLDEIGIDYVEGGYPGANPLDTELFSKDRKLDTTFTAFGMTRRPGRSTSNDPGLASLLDAKADAICFVAKSWDYHVRVALETTEEENLASIRDSVKAAKAKGREVLLDCEHFFDGYKANPDYALACAKAAYDAGARWVVLCDTNGGALPHEVEEIVADVVKHIPGDHVGIHAHNDTEQAVANSLAAVRAGARQIQGTLNGLGERCGNANLVSIIPTLEAQAGVCRPLRHRRVGREAQGPRPHLARARRDPQPRAEPLRALCRRERVRDQGRHPCLRDPEGPRDLRTHRARRGRQQAQGDRVGSGRARQRAGRARPHRPQGRQERSAHHDAARGGEAPRGSGLRLRVGRRLVRSARAPHARQGAGLLRGAAVRRQYRAAQQCARPARDGVDGGGEGQGRRPDPDLGRRRQRPGQCARRGAAQGPRQVPEIHRRTEAHRLPRAFSKRL